MRWPAWFRKTVNYFFFSFFSHPKKISPSDLLATKFANLKLMQSLWKNFSQTKVNAAIKRRILDFLDILISAFGSPERFHNELFNDKQLMDLIDIFRDSKIGQLSMKIVVTLSENGDFLAPFCLFIFSLKLFVIIFFF